MKKFLALLFFQTLFLVHAIIAQSNTSSYRISGKIHVDGDAGWDYLAADETTGRLFISHGTMVQVMDLKSQKIIGTISGMKGVHGIALAKDLNKGFISSGRDSSVVVFNLETFAMMEKIIVTGKNPDAILYDSFSHRVFTFNGGSSNSTVMDAVTNKIIGTIALSGKPEFAVSDGKGNVFVNIEDKSRIAKINAVKTEVDVEWPVSPGEEPSGLAIDRDNNRLFSVCDNKKMVILDSKSGRVIAALPIGEHVDGVAFDPAKKRAYSSNGEGTLTVVQEKDPEHFNVIEHVTTQKGARTIAVNTKTHHVYLPTAEYGETPEATETNPHPRPSIKPGTFVILDLEPVK